MTVLAREDQEDSLTSCEDEDEGTWCKCENCPHMKRITERVCCMDECKWHEHYNNNSEFCVSTLNVYVILCS